MVLPKSKDIQLERALLSAIAQSKDYTAVAEELRPIIEKELSLIVADDQKMNWTATVSNSLIGMRDKYWLLSPYYKPETKLNKSMNRKWLEENRPGVDTEKRIWKITEEGMSALHEGLPSDQQIASKKSAPTEALSKLAGPRLKKGRSKLKYDDAGGLMHTYYKAHFNELPMQIKLQREFIIDLLMKGMSAEVAFSRAIKNMA